MLKKVLSFSLIYFFIHSVIICLDGFIDNNFNGKIPFGVVLGNTVHKDGSVSNRLKARLDKSIELYQNDKINKIVVSGGLGKEGHWEGTKMAEYLIKKGIDSTNIVIDNQGNTTNYTAENFCKMGFKDSSVVLISQYHHINRLKIAFHKKGVLNYYGAVPNYFELRDFYAIFREYFAFYKYLFI